MSLSLINGSDGTGEAVVATVSAARTAGSMSISVSGLAHWSTSFVATSGKQLSGGVLSTPLVFSGHKSGTNTIVIDTIAPGYTDAGNAVGDIIVIKPSTMWADNIATTLGKSLNDDGSLKTGAVNSASVLANNVVTTSSILDSSVVASKLVGINLYGLGAAQSGTPPPRLTGQFYMQAGTSVLILSSYTGSITFPVAFPNGVLTVLPAWGDNGVMAPITVVSSSVGTTGFAINTSGSASGTVRVNWIAIGF